MRTLLPRVAITVAQAEALTSDCFLANWHLRSTRCDDGERGPLWLIAKISSRGASAFTSLSMMAATRCPSEIVAPPERPDRLS